MDATLIVKFLHVLSAMALVTGLVGRWIANAHAERSMDIGTTDALLEVSRRFERMVIGASFAVLVSGLLMAWLLSLPVLGVLQGSPTNWILISLALFILVLGLLPPIVFLPASRTFEAALATARRAGTKTPELRAAFANGRVRAANVVELAAVFIVIGLMVLKPF